MSLLQSRRPRQTSPFMTVWKRVQPWSAVSEPGMLEMSDDRVSNVACGTGIYMVAVLTG